MDQALITQLEEQVTALQSTVEQIKSQQGGEQPPADGGGSEQPVDTTPYDQADIDAAVAAATEESKKTIEGLQLQLSQKDVDALEEAIADQLASLAQSLRDRTVKSAPVDETPVEPAPVEGQQ